MDNVDESRGVGELGEQETARFNGVADDGDAGAVELLIGIIPELAESGLGFDAAVSVLRAEIL